MIDIEKLEKLKKLSKAYLHLHNRCEREIKIINLDNNIKKLEAENKAIQIQIQKNNSLCAENCKEL